MDLLVSYLLFNGQPVVKLVLIFRLETIHIKLALLNGRSPYLKTKVNAGQTHTPGLHPPIRWTYEVVFRVNKQGSYFVL